MEAQQLDIDSGLLRIQIHKQTTHGKNAKKMSQWYVTKMDWGGTSFGGITLKWNYEGERWVELSLPGYIDKILA